MKITDITYSKFAEKQLLKLPKQIYESLLAWESLVTEVGIYEARKIKGYHDEPLKGDRTGQRSIRLNRSYRAIYEITETGSIVLITIMEINKHDY